MKQLIAFLLILPWLVNAVSADSKAGTITKRSWLAYTVDMPENGQSTIDYTLMWKNKSTLGASAVFCHPKDVSWESNSAREDRYFTGGSGSYAFGDGQTKVLTNQVSTYGEQKVCTILITAWWGPSSAFLLSADIKADAGIGAATSIPKAELVPHSLTDEESQALTDRLLGN